MDVSYYAGGDTEFYKDVNTHPNNKHIATITLIFSPNEIGTDYSAGNELAKKEAIKLGADWIYYVSSTIYKDTSEIAAITFRCVRTTWPDMLDKIEKDKREIAEKEFEMNNARKELLEYSTFYNILTTAEIFGKSETELNKLIGVKAKKERKKDSKVETITYIDTVTNKVLNEKEVEKRGMNYFFDKIFAIYVNNLELYKTEYDEIMRILGKYPKAKFYFPELDTQGNIDKQKMKEEIFGVE
ncbi:MAG: hypothetical protein CVU80_02000 [Elusimicrobia bacterium HGW-Elusimicrobia-4]|nr:MAG: hypothetical protein CVU80_02000 [Elusimicrobia bacterium HGW-Elusimicrobia-4]